MRNTFKLAKMVQRTRISMADELQAFLGAVKSNPDLQQKLSEASDLESAITVAKEFGYELSLDALQSLSKTDELSDQDLELAAGGKRGILSWVMLTACEIIEIASNDANSVNIMGNGCCK